MNLHSIQIRRYAPVFMALAAGFCAAQEAANTNAPASEWLAPRRRVRRVYSQSVQWHNLAAESVPTPAVREERAPPLTPDSRLLNPFPSSSAAVPPPRPERPPESAESARPDLWLLAPMDTLLGTTNTAPQPSGFGWLADEVAAQTAERKTRENERREEAGEEEDPEENPFAESAVGSAPPSLFLRRGAVGTGPRPSAEPEIRSFQQEMIFRNEPTFGADPEIRTGVSAPAPDRTERTAAGSRWGTVLPSQDAARSWRAERPGASREDISRAADRLPGGLPEIRFFPGAAVVESRDSRPTGSGVPASSSLIGQGAEAYGRIGTIFRSTSEFRPAARGAMTPVMPGAVPGNLPGSWNSQPQEATQPFRPLESPVLRAPPSSVPGARPGSLTPFSPDLRINP